MRSDQELTGLIVAKEFLAKAPDRDQTVGARAVKLDEQTEARHRGDATQEGSADMGGHIGRYITIHGSALGCDRATLAH